jgi:hypothetical protein
MIADTSKLNQNLLFTMSLLLQKNTISRFRNVNSLRGKSLKQIYIEAYNHKNSELKHLVEDRTATITKRVTTIPKNIGIIAHSGYIVDRARNGIQTIRVPEHVEIVIFNTPGYTIHTEQLKENWEFNSKYLNDIPIDILKQYFPGLRSENNVIPAPNLDPSIVSPCDPQNKKYIQAISGSILFKFPLSKVHCHCYSSGDIIPELLFEAKQPSPRSADIATLIAGVYDTNNSFFEPYSGDIVYTQYRDSFDSTSESLRARILEIGHLNSNPLQPFYQVQPVGEQKKLSDIITANPAPPGTRIRLVIVSCGDCIDSADVNKKMQQMSEHQFTRILSVKNSQEYRRYLTALGHSLRDEIMKPLLHMDTEKLNPLEQEISESNRTLQIFTNGVANSISRPWPMQGGKGKRSKSRRVRFNSNIVFKRKRTRKNV